MADVDLYHPEIDVRITVPEEAAWVRLDNGWLLADPETEPETEPIYDTAGPPKPARSAKSDKEES